MGSIASGVTKWGVEWEQVSNNTTLVGRVCRHGVGNVDSGLDFGVDGLGRNSTVRVNKYFIILNCAVSCLVLPHVVMKEMFDFISVSVVYQCFCVVSMELERVSSWLDVDTSFVVVIPDAFDLTLVAFVTTKCVEIAL